MKKYLAPVFLLIISFSIIAWKRINRTQNIQTKVNWKWEDKFSQTEQDSLKLWINTTIKGIEELVGAYPFEISIYFHKSKSKREPVPWAHTDRGEEQAVHFYVNPTYFKYKDFITDWTAPHEISHLILPFLGKQNSWFAEGFASYMQYRVMQKMNVISKNQMNEIFAKKLEMISPYYRQKNKNMIECAKNLRQKYQFPAMYWGSAVFFMTLNSRLESTNQKGFTEILKKYLNCCRLKSMNLEDVISDWEKLSPNKIVEKEYQFLNTISAKEYLVHSSEELNFVTKN